MSSSLSKMDNSYFILSRKLEKCQVNPCVTLGCIRLRQPTEPPTWPKLTLRSRSLYSSWHFDLLKELILGQVHAVMPSNYPQSHPRTSYSSWTRADLRSFLPGNTLFWKTRKILLQVPSEASGLGIISPWRKLWVLKRVHFYTHQISQFIFLFK